MSYVGKRGEEKLSLPYAVPRPLCRVWYGGVSLLSVDNPPLAACGAQQCRADSRLWTLAAEMKSVPPAAAARCSCPRPENAATHTLYSGMFVSCLHVFTALLLSREEFIRNDEDCDGITCRPGLLFFRVSLCVLCCIIPRLSVVYG